MKEVKIRMTSSENITLTCKNTIVTIVFQLSEDGQSNVYCVSYAGIEDDFSTLSAALEFAYRAARKEV